MPNVTRPFKLQRGKARPRRKAPRAKKISLTVDERVLRDVERDARRAGRSLSAHVTEALARDVRRRHLQAIIEEYEAEHGVISEEELTRARAEWLG